MVPLRLTLRNFLCYADECPAVDFSDLTMACLCGDNGHGKSALLDAMTWALWGQARARSDDELVHTGRVDMEVQLEFRVGTVQYRVMRKRRRGSGNSPGRSLLEFHVRSGEDWKPLTGATMRDSQQRINEAVRLDYDTFRNSAFLMQGRADEFTVKPAGERKKVLADILGLSAYDAYESKSREERRRWEGEAKRLDAQMASFAAEIEREPLYRRQRDETQQELQETESDLRDKRALVSGLQQIAQAVGLLHEQVQAAARDCRQAGERRQRAQDELERQESSIAQRIRLVERADEIRERAERLKLAQACESEQAAKLARVAALQRAHAEVSAEIQRAEALLNSARERLASEVQRQQAIADRGEQARARRAAADAERVALDAVQKHLESRRQELQELHNLSGQLEATNKRLREDMTELARKRDELLSGQGSLCPICRQDLGVEGKQRVRAEYEREGSELAAQFRQNKTKRETAESRGNALQAETRRLDADLATRGSALQKQLGEIERDEQDGAEAAKRLPELRHELQEVETRLAQRAYAPEAQAKLTQIDADIDVAGYDAAAHERARAEARTLSGADRALSELQLAEQAIAAAREAAERARQDLAEWQAALEAAQERERDLRTRLAAQADPAEPLQRAQNAVSQLEERERSLRLALGAAEQKLEDCERYRRMHDAQQVQRAEARLKQQIFEDLAAAFGRKGVQALIIDAVLPEIEDEANRLLARMSNGRMSVAITTQRDTQKGQPVETLDISIADELGTRSYELFSGGEAFRINLALRIALSKLLARRAGAPLPTLIVDEGFGTQDASGRERLLEAINAVSRDFECLIVITHLDELKDQFERQIRVEKTSRGSIARVI